VDGVPVTTHTPHENVTIYSIPQAGLGIILHITDMAIDAHSVVAMTPDEATRVALALLGATRAHAAAQDTL
jgi:hypothetical protein